MASFEPREAAADHIAAGDWIRNFVWLSEVDSTNSEARRALTQSPGATHLSQQVGGTWRIAGNAGGQEVGGTWRVPGLWVADRQTAGRGRTRNVWWSPPGCLMLSLAIGEEDLPGDISTRPLLSLVVGVALLRAAERLTGLASLELKWPNDLYVAGKKGAGILIETIPDQLSAVGPVWIIGIGLNVAVPWHEAPPDVATKGICLSLASGRAIPVESALVELIESLRSELESWRSGSWDWLHLWNERSLLSDKIVQLRLPTGEVLVGRCEGIDLHGRLLLRDQLQTHAVGAAEVVSWDSV